MRKTKSITSKSGLARRLELSRPTLDKYLSMPGAPKKGREGFDLAAVVNFIGANAERESTACKAAPDLKAARVRELLLRCERLKFLLDRERGIYVLRSEVQASIRRIMGPAVIVLEQRLVNEYPTGVAGMDVPQARIYGKRLCDELMEFLQSLKTEWT
jgi:hypothetical protein